MEFKHRDTQLISQARIKVIRRERRGGGYLLIFKNQVAGLQALEADAKLVASQFRSPYLPTNPTNQNTLLIGK